MTVLQHNITSATITIITRTQEILLTIFTTLLWCVEHMEWNPAQSNRLCCSFDELCHSNVIIRYTSNIMRT